MSGAAGTRMATLREQAKTSAASLPRVIRNSLSHNTNTLGQSATNT